METVIIFFGQYFGYILVGLLALFLLKKRYTRLVLEMLAAAVLSRGIITEAIRFFFPQDRPFVENGITPIIEHSASSSFPSGHASLFFALGTVLYFYNKKAGILFLLASAAIGIARVFAGLHWPIDIIAGALIGIGSGWVVVKLSRKFKN
ncbi:MAG: phosphatase PAP2 family protein [Candidatus Wildermuthbacteria bacterium]|nr:phosphatase PAP2 family protein [Candidatus Wildermuthbacteria bacterium]